jgi:hypothetical protein
MKKRLDQKFQVIVGHLVNATWAFSILFGLAVVIPLFLWSAWVNHQALVNSVLVTLFCLSFGWGLVSMVLCLRSMRRLGLDGQDGLKLFSGGRPTDPEELRTWNLGWHFMCAVLAVIICMIAIPLASYLGGK